MARQDDIRLLTAMRGGLGLSLAQSQRPDLILLDLHLPDMSGEAVLSQLKQSPATWDVPVVILSAEASPGQLERLVSAGALAYLIKPFDVTEMLALISSVLKQESAAQPLLSLALA